MIKDLGMRRLSRWALHGITSVLMREGDLTQTEDRRYDREGALSDTAKYERRSEATRASRTYQVLECRAYVSQICFCKELASYLPDR